MNDTTFSNHSSSHIILDDLPIRVVKIFALSLVIFVALVGNSLVIATVLQTRRMRTITNYLIVNLAVVDIFYTLIAMPHFILEAAKYEWSPQSLFFRFFCKAANFSQYVLQADSVLTLALIATDRYFAIMMPFKKFLTKKVFWIALGCIWFVSILVASPILYAYDVFKYNDDLAYCAEEWEPLFDTEKASKFYTIVLFVVLYCIPFIAMTIAYCVICNKLWTRKLIGELNHSGKKILESRKKVVKMLVTVLLLFVVCWLPVQILSFLADYSNVDIPVPLFFVCFFVMHAHPAINPCVYVIFCENFRDGFKMALKCYVCRKDKTELLGYPKYKTTKTELKSLKDQSGDTTTC